MQVNILFANAKAKKKKGVGRLPHLYMIDNQLSFSLKLSLNFYVIVPFLVIV